MSLETALIDPPASPDSLDKGVDVVTFGESMALFLPVQEGPLKYAPLFHRSIAGAESNLAIALTRLGKRARWISRVGCDPFGDLIVATLVGEGVEVSQVIRDPDAPTAVFFREYRPLNDPHVYYYRSGSAASRLCPEDIQPGWFDGARCLHVTGITPALSESAAETVREAMRQARERGLFVSFDPNLRRKLWPEERARRTLLSLVPLCDLFLPGMEEAEFLVGKQSPEKAGKAFLELGAKGVVLKQGEQGASAFTNGAGVHAPAVRLPHLVDSIGAGDAFASGFLSVLLDHPDFLPDDPASLLPLLQAGLRRAHHMGAFATQFRGDWEGLPTLAELEQFRTGNRAITR